PLDHRAVYSCSPPATTPLHPLSLHDALPISSHVAGLHLPLIRRGDAVLRLIPFGNTSADHNIGQYIVRRIVDFYRLIDRVCTARSEEHTSELQSRFDLVCRLLLENKNDLIIT